MTKKEIIKRFRLAASLMEIHGENEFKVRGFTNAVFNLERHTGEVDNLSIEELCKIEGIGKSIAGNIADICSSGSFKILDDLLAVTPPTLLEVVDIKGLGPKKIRILWKDLGIESLEDLKEACEANKIATIKGFGQKTQENILKDVNYILSNKFKLHYAEAELIAKDTENRLKVLLPDADISVAGETRRKMEVVDEILFVIGTNALAATYDKLSELDFVQHLPKDSGPLNWRGLLKENGVRLHFALVKKEKFYNHLLLYSGSEKHLANCANNNMNLLAVIFNQKLDNEKQAYESLDLQYVEPELREGGFEIELARKKELPKLLEYDDFKGSLHNHSTYSDGANTLREMAEKCIELGYEYLGISDHSQSAFYANGLQEFTVRKQHEEIDKLNEELAPFKIFKGIESDILNEGALDYEDHVLASFDFIVASVHSNLNMDVQKATQRLLTAIQNPHTTILGHATGRLLLRREGYPIDHKAVIDACAANDVIIEINANPWRLDIDWRWVRYALEQGVMLSVNPDAHETAGFRDMYYGVQAGRKGGLTKEQTFNCLGAAEVEKYFKDRKARKNIDGK